MNIYNGSLLAVIVISFSEIELKIDLVVSELYPALSNRTYEIMHYVLTLYIILFSSSMTHLLTHH